MLELIAFSILFFLCATTASGTAKLFMITIGEGELFSGWQTVLAKIEPERGDRFYFLRELAYKRLGGCTICTRQFIAELSFVFFCILFTAYANFPTSYIEIAILRWICNVAIFVGYCGLTLQIGQWLEYEKKQPENEPIIETIYRKTDN